MTYFGKITLVAGFTVACRDARENAWRLLRRLLNNLGRDASCPLLRQKTEGGANLGSLRNEKATKYSLLSDAFYHRHIT